MEVCHENAYILIARGSGDCRGRLHSVAAAAVHGQQMIVLTASPDELQTFVRRHEGDTFLSAIFLSDYN
jgi:hypothetical protein